MCKNDGRVNEIPVAPQNCKIVAEPETAPIHDNSLEAVDCIKEEPIEMMDIFWEASKDQIDDFIVGPSSIEVANNKYVSSFLDQDNTDGIGTFAKTRRMSFTYRPNSEFVIKTEAVDDSNVVMTCKICDDRSPYIGSKELKIHIEGYHKMACHFYEEMYPDFRITEEGRFAITNTELKDEDPVTLDSKAHTTGHFDASNLEERDKNAFKGGNTSRGKLKVQDAVTLNSQAHITALNDASKLENRDNYAPSGGKILRGKEECLLPKNSPSPIMGGGVTLTGGHIVSSLDKMEETIKNKGTQKNVSNNPEPFYKGCEYRCNSCGEIRGSLEHIREHVRKFHKNLQHCDRANYDMIREEHFDCVICGANMLRDYLIIKMHVRSRHKMGMVEYARDYVNKK